MRRNSRHEKNSYWDGTAVRYIGGMKKLVLADDHAIVREGFRALIEREADLRVAADVRTTSEAEAAIAQHAPDAVVVDLNLPEEGGLALLPRLRTRYPQLGLIVLSMHNREPYISEALSRGADAYVSKDAAADELITAIRATLDGGSYLSTDLAAHRRAAIADQHGVSLSEREVAVLIGLAKGRVPKRIAGDLDIGVKTVYVHRNNLFQKLGRTMTQTELREFALARGWMSGAD